MFTVEGFSHLFCLMCLNSQGVGTSALEEYEVRLGEMEDADPDNAEVEAALSYLADIQDDIEEHSAYVGRAQRRAAFVAHRLTLGRARLCVLLRVRRQFTHAEGSALYATHSAMNHACEANAECRYALQASPAKAPAAPRPLTRRRRPSPRASSRGRFVSHNAIVHVVATRPIRAGEEIVLCYLDDADEMPVTVRPPRAWRAGRANACQRAQTRLSTPWPLQERRKMLLDYYLFECVCARCQRDLQHAQAMAGASAKRRAGGGGGSSGSGGGGGGVAGSAGNSGKGKRVLR